MKRYAALYDTAVQLAKCCVRGPFRYMEIGVWTGEGAARLLARVARETVAKCAYYGFDLFDQPTDVADDQASRKRGGTSTMKQVQTVLKEAAASEGTTFDAYLIAGDSRETLPRWGPGLPPMDLIFIDGGHSLETIASDWEQVSQIMTAKTVVFFDDYYHDHTAVGAAKTVAGIDRGRYAVEVLPPDRIGSGRVVSLVRVTKIATG